MRAVWILWLRQIKRYSRSRSRMIGSLGMPILFLFGLGFGFGPIYARAGSGNYVEFVAPGIIAMGIIFHAVFGGIEIIWDRQFGFLKETLVAPVPRLAIVLGRTLGGTTTALLQGVIVLVICLIAGFRIHHPLLLPVALVFMFLIALVFAAIGTAIGSVLKDMQGFQLIMNFLVMPLFFFSNALFPTDGLPAPLRFVVRLNPLSYGVAGMRDALAGVASLDTATDLVVLGALAAVLLGVSSFLFSRIECDREPKSCHSAGRRIGRGSLASLATGQRKPVSPGQQARYAPCVRCFGRRHSLVSWLSPAGAILAFPPQ